MLIRSWDCVEVSSTMVSCFQGRSIQLLAPFRGSLRKPITCFLLQLLFDGIEILHLDLAMATMSLCLSFEFGFDIQHLQDIKKDS